MNKARPRQVSFRMSDKEYAEFKQKISSSGVNQQRYLLKTALDSKIINPTGLVAISNELKALRTEMKREGNNLNQIAKKLHEGGFINEDDMNTICKVRSAIIKSLERIESTWSILREIMNHGRH